MFNHQDSAEKTLLESSDISLDIIHDCFGRSLQGVAPDFADLYFSSSQSENWTLDEGIIKEASYNSDKGFGCRIINGEQTGFAYADRIDPQILREAIKASRTIAKNGQNHSLPILKLNSIKDHYYPIANPFMSFSAQQKVELLQELDRYARSKDPAVKQVMLSLSASHDVILVMQYNGSYSTDIRPIVSFHVRVIVERSGKREPGSAGCGSRLDYTFIQENAKACVDKAIHQALINLDAKPAPAGQLPVVLGPGWPAVLIHEAVGHGLEADAIRQNTSVYKDSLGQMVASECCTIVDDATLANSRGSLSIDDEGVKGQKTVLIENGKLMNFMYDKHNAALMGKASTGNGRREGYSSLPIPRMTNTYLKPGIYNPDEIIASVADGIYAVDFSGGQVDVTSGQFVFSASEAYRIENGKVTYPIKGATLIGSGPEVIKKISMVGNDLALDPGIGVCGKDGQSVSVGVGQPTVKVDVLTVGGTEQI